MWPEGVTNLIPNPLSPHDETKKRGRTARDTRPNIAGETGGEIKVPICANGAKQQGIVFTHNCPLKAAGQQFRWLLVQPLGSTPS